jgi:hypothetical protein
MSLEGVSATIRAGIATAEFIEGKSNKAGIVERIAKTKEGEDGTGVAHVQGWRVEFGSRRARLPPSPMTSRS